MNKEIYKWLIVASIIFAYSVLRDVDPTDKDRFNRSGMSFYKDHGTGCHYLSIQSGFFGKGQLIPRKDKEDKQICD